MVSTSLAKDLKRWWRQRHKLSAKEVRFLLYAVVALCLLVAYATTGDEASRLGVAESFAEHRREVSESFYDEEPPVVENMTSEAIDFGDEEHTVIIDLRPEDPTHKYLDPDAKVNRKNIKEAISSEGKEDELNVNGQFRGQYLSHMELGNSKKKARSRSQTISRVRANPHKTLSKKGSTRRSRSPYARGHTADTVYYQSGGGAKARGSRSRSAFHLDGHGTG
ncbi:hypothetical protein HOP50_03g20880 [Chloropicon primus]|uniref:Uncharacterized protein n=1 Tax=Chloropicon primus TaxID=1764295 RepID=A0A5B8MJK3_9CHLO|nr:hypothetical protein A3770_03p20880 [Chloropicon primus]UPQ98782.1 hypothetical protein HOP50_03g20880 [Chloropicon primus]|eukprot:QDZ19570.1 hypothetical protein A3770_03p20880 [Chloropicon primus]